MKSSSFFIFFPLFFCFYAKKMSNNAEMGLVPALFLELFAFPR